MIVEQLIQRLPRAESVSLAATSAEDAEAIVAWALNDRFTYQGEVEGEPGVHLFRYYEQAATWYWELRSDSGCYLVRYEPAQRPDTAAEVSWPENYAQQWEPFDGSPLAP